MRKKTFILIFVLMAFGVAGVFFYLAAREDLARYYHKMESKRRAIRMQEGIDDMIKLVNGQKKPKMVKV